jgi:hypothetical protein
MIQEEEDLLLEGPGGPDEHFAGTELLNDRLRDFSAQPGHSGEEPSRGFSPMERKEGGAGSIHGVIIAQSFLRCQRCEGSGGNLDLSHRPLYTPLY